MLRDGFDSRIPLMLFWLTDLFMAWLAFILLVVAFGMFVLMLLTLFDDE